MPGWIPIIAVICREVTEERQLARNLVKVNRQKDALLATVAHELRNPLAPMANAVEMLKKIGTDDVLRVHGIMYRQLQQMPVAFSAGR